MTLLRLRPAEKVGVLNDLTGLIRSGEMLLVLGRPGSGCSTLLKALAGDTHSFTLEPEAAINYQGKKLKPQTSGQSSADYVSGVYLPAPFRVAVSTVLDIYRWLEAPYRS
jgi:ABC-type multidrug transport system ATPase subunit